MWNHLPSMYQTKQDHPSRLLSSMVSIKHKFQIFMDFIGLLQMHMFCGTIISYKIYVEKVSK